MFKDFQTIRKRPPLLKYVIMISIIGVAAVGIIAVLMAAKRLNKYVKRNLFSAAELSFFKVLEQAVGNKYKIFAKIRLADLIGIAAGLGKSERQSAFNRIKGKHVDFVLCDPGDLSVRCVIELDDSSHDATDRKTRDLFVDAALKSAGIPIARFAARRQYVAGDIDKTIEEARAAAQLEYRPEKAGAPACSLCGAAMVLRTTQKGEHAGKPFYGCSAYPKCKNTAQFISLKDTQMLKNILR